MRSQSTSNHNSRFSTSKASNPAAPVFATRKWTRPRDDGDQRSFEFAGRDAAAGGPAFPKREAPAAASAAAPLFQSSDSCCSDSAVIAPEAKPNRTYYVLKPCHCRKWYCEDCAPWMGRKLRGRLRDRLKAFKHVFGITLTLDGSLFGSPEEAWRYVMDKRLLSLLVKKLFNAGYLNSRDYFWVLEWQKNTQQAHWHVLVDSRFIPYGKVVEFWSSFRPKWAPALPEKVTADNYRSHRPAFGSVRYSFDSYTDAYTAAGYAIKYLIKTPAHGFPDWVLDYEGRVPRFGHNRGFFPDGKSSSRKSPDSDVSFDVERFEREPKTLRQRIAQCKQQTIVLRVIVTKTEDGERIESKPEFRQLLKVPFHAACGELGVSPEECREIRVKFDAILRLWRLESHGAELSRCTNVVKEDDWWC